MKNKIKEGLLMLTNWAKKNQLADIAEFRQMSRAITLLK